MSSDDSLFSFDRVYSSHFASHSSLCSSQFVSHHDEAIRRFSSYIMVSGRGPSPVPTGRLYILCLYALLDACPCCCSDSLCLSCSRRVVCALLWFVRPVSVCVCLCRGLCVGRCWPSVALTLVCMGYIWWPWERTEPNANRSLYIGWLVQNRILGFVKKKKTFAIYNDN